MMGFVESLKTCFRKYFTFSGRATRAEFWWFYLFLAIVTVLLSVVEFQFTIMGPSLVFSLATLIPSFSVVARRLHDIGYSGWWQLSFYLSPVLIAGIAALVVYGQGTDTAIALGAAAGVGLALGLVLSFVLIIAMGVIRSQMHENKYGPIPSNLVEEGASAEPASAQSAPEPAAESQDDVPADAAADEPQDDAPADAPEDDSQDDAPADAPADDAPADAPADDSQRS